MENNQGVSVGKDGLTVITLQPKVDTVMKRLREASDKQGGTLDAFADRVLRTALSAQAKAAARLIRAKIGDGIMKWGTLGMTAEQIQAKIDDAQRRAAGLDALAVELED